VVAKQCTNSYFWPVANMHQWRSILIHKCLLQDSSRMTNFAAVGWTRFTFVEIALDKAQFQIVESNISVSAFDICTVHCVTGNEMVASVRLSNALAQSRRVYVRQNSWTVVIHLDIVLELHAALPCYGALRICQNDLALTTWNDTEHFMCTQMLRNVAKNQGLGA